MARMGPGPYDPIFFYTVSSIAVNQPIAVIHRTKLVLWLKGLLIDMCIIPYYSLPNFRRTMINTNKY